MIEKCEICPYCGSKFYDAVIEEVKPEETKVYSEFANNRKGGYITVMSKGRKASKNTAKQQLARHINFSHKGTPEMDYAIRKRYGIEEGEKI